MLFLMIMICVASFLLGVWLGLVYGFGVGIRYYEKFSIWECKCEKGKCDLFGTYEQAEDHALGCKKGRGRIGVKQLEKLEIRDVSGLG